MQMAYKGSHASVYVAALRRVVQRDEPTEIEDSHLRGQLARQEWVYVHTDEDNEDKEGEDS